MKILFLTIILVLSSIGASAQQLNLAMSEEFNVAELLPDNVQINGSSQGMAIWGRYAFLMHDKGQCVVVDIRRKKFINTYIMEGNTGHCNNASFGNEYYSIRILH